MIIKYFTDLKENFTEFELKMAYKKLAFENHPDKGGSVSDFQAIANEYEYLNNNIDNVKVKMNINSEEISNFDDFCASIDEEIYKMHLKIRALRDTLSFKYEICGIYMYVTCKKEDKDHFKNIGMFWNRNKKMWCFKPSWYKCFNRKAWSMDEIRGYHGSVTYGGKKQEKLSA